MTLFHRMIATALGIGYVGKGGGTVAALICSLIWYFLMRGFNNFVPALFITVGIIILGIWSAGKMEPVWGKDSQRVVIDEVAGMCVGLLWIPVHPLYIFTAFLLFRFFDIAKPFFIRKLEKLPAGWGVMADDVLAGLYTNFLLQGILALNLFR